MLTHRIFYRRKADIYAEAFDRYRVANQKFNSKAYNALLFATCAQDVMQKHNIKTELVAGDAVWYSRKHKHERMAFRCDVAALPAKMQSNTFDFYTWLERPDTCEIIDFFYPTLQQAFFALIWAKRMAKGVPSSVDPWTVSRFIWCKSPQLAYYAPSEIATICANGVATKLRRTLLQQPK